MVLIPEDDVNIAVLNEYLRRAFMNVSEPHEGSFMTLGSLVNTQIRLDEGKKDIHLIFVQKLQYLNMAEACQACNTANSTLAYVTFSIEIDNGSVMLLAISTLDYKHGIIAPHLHRAVLVFEKVVEQALRSIFAKYL